ncbi:hypothetical protein BC939DRAFT_439193, partial [Gamsiella multidivaricata]|uniref:uncharacterized protein n=1 Tax=Gamsiella multidivaricata TaxID=101098 RepID=UPI00221E8176
MQFLPLASIPEQMFDWAAFTNVTLAAPILLLNYPDSSDCPTDEQTIAPHQQ